MLGQFIFNFGAHFSPAFLIFGNTTTLRHGDGSWGVLLVTTFLLCLYAVFSIIRRFFKRKSPKLNSVWVFYLFWIFAGLTPSALGLEVPHSNRALLALPGFLLLAVFGLKQLQINLKKSKSNGKMKGSHGEKNLLLKSVVGVVILTHSLLFMAYWFNYFSVFAKTSANDFKEGYLEAFEFVIPFEKGIDGHAKIGKVVFTDHYGQPYIYALFTRQTNPIWYQGGSLNTYDFHSVDIADLQRKDALVVSAGTEDTPVNSADKVIYGTDGSIRFKIHILNSEQ